ncbi:MAG: radical SAM protein, partial [Syntrophorhabdus sp.]
RRTVEEVKKDIDNMEKEYAVYKNMIRSAFLQDADSLVLKTSEVLDIINYTREKFPNLERITTYARATTLKRKTVDELTELCKAGLTRIHVGMESGSEKVLKMIRKGITPQDIVEGGQKVVAAGMSLSEYIMPGVGGREFSKENAIETASLLNQIKPDFIRVRTFAMHPKSPMMKLVEDGTFVPMNDIEIVEEIRLLVQTLDKMHSYFSCGDFSLNLLMQVDGYLDEKKEYMLSELDKFLSLERDQQKAYCLIRRSSYMQYPIEAVQNEEVMNKVRPEIEKLEKDDPKGFDKYVEMLKSYQLPQPQTDDWK